MNKIKILPFAFLLMTGCADSSSSNGGTSPSLCMKPEKAQALLYSAQSVTTSGESLSGNSFIVKLRNQENGKESLVNNLKEVSQDSSKISVQAINESLTKVTISGDSNEYDVLNQYIQNKEIDFLEPDYPIQQTALLNDPSITKQWAHSVINSAAAWDITEGQNVIVGVIDSGLDIDHPDIRDNVYRNPKEIINGLDDDGNGYVDDTTGWNFSSDSRYVLSDDSSYHGTHVSGTIGAVGDNGIGVTGHAPKVKILPLKYLNSAAAGVTSNAIRAIDYAIKMKVRILSNSWGSFTASSSLQNAIKRAGQAGILFVAAAGNGDSAGNGVNLDRTGFYPAAYPENNILSVAASNSNDVLAGWSNYGAKTVDIAAPGVGIFSLRNMSAGSYATLSGTSMAAPLVAGVAALVWSQRPELSYKAVKNILLASVDKVSSMKNKVLASGRINAFKAVNLAKTYQYDPSLDGDENSNGIYPNDETNPDLANCP